LLALALCGLLIRRWVHSALAQRQMTLEMKQAQEVQQVLIPEAVPQIPGFSIQSVYQPAGQVGGDFFQTLPATRGGVLLCIGDVSGKGMPAAMTVSLLVGTLRTLAHYTESPGEILAAMNQRMLGRSRGGFTTCLILLASTDGTVTVANAGHIAPYLNGVELIAENGLPLGLVAESAYAESTFHQQENEQITLVTDGVVEARDASGELFGFERTAAIAAQSAESIAKTAQDFGQDDDITVLTLTRLPVSQPSAKPQAATTLSPLMA
jgi:serine phosphatase RsbU (regulator of sigma subunit)